MDGSHRTAVAPSVSLLPREDSHKGPPQMGNRYFQGFARKFPSSSFIPIDLVCCVVSFPRSRIETPPPASRTLRRWQTQRNSAPPRQPKRLQVARPRMAPLPPAAEIAPPTKTKRVYSSAPRPPPAKRVYSSAHCLPTIDEDDGVLRRRVDVLAPRQPAKRVESSGLDQSFPSSPKEDTSPPPAPPPSPSPPSPSAPPRLNPLPTRASAVAQSAN